MGTNKEVLIPYSLCCSERDLANSPHLIVNMAASHIEKEDSQTKRGFLSVFKRLFSWKSQQASPEKGKTLGAGGRVENQIENLHLKFRILVPIRKLQIV